MHETPLIYNLFPRLVGSFDRWEPHARRAAAMGFNWVYLNPLHYPGFSGSLYAVKEHYRINPDFLPAGTQGNGLGELRAALDGLRAHRLRPMMDLVINHTSKDSPLVVEHPEWYVWENGEVASPWAIDPADARQRTVWGDLAEIDNEGSPDREGLWGYWAGLVRHSLELGFDGFRCDAAYKVPSDLWRHLIETARQVRPDVQFFAETLGARIGQVLALHDAGFDFVFNSSKWWDFRDPWALEQHEDFGRIAPSISFPESHDTPRLAAETGGAESVQRQRYAFAAAFSAGLKLPVGYEYGFRTPLNVVHTRPDDWETLSFDLTGFIRRVNQCKLSCSILQGEGELQSLLPLDDDVLVLERRSDRAPGEVAWILVNKRAGQPCTVPLAGLVQAAVGHRLYRVCRDDAPESGEPVTSTAELAPAEVAYLLRRERVA